MTPLISRRASDPVHRVVLGGRGSSLYSIYRFRVANVEIEARNLDAQEVIVEVTIRPLSRRAVVQAVHEASTTSPELQHLTSAALDNLGSTITAELSHILALEGGAQEKLMSAIRAATRKHPEFANISEEAQTSILVALLGRVPKEQRDVAVPILAMRSAERLGRQTVIASWSLVAATIGLLVATAGLIVATILH